MNGPVLLLGIHGAGKTTAGSYLSDHFGGVHISAGTILRRARDSKGELSADISTQIDAGDEVPVEISYGLLEQEFRTVTDSSFVTLDGYPANKDQIDLLHSTLGLEPALTIHLDIPVRRRDRSLSDRDNLKLLKQAVLDEMNEALCLLRDARQPHRTIDFVAERIESIKDDFRTGRISPRIVARDVEPVRDLVLQLRLTGTTNVAQAHRQYELDRDGTDRFDRWLQEGPGTRHFASARWPQYYRRDEFRCPLPSLGEPSCVGHPAARG